MDWLTSLGPDASASISAVSTAVSAIAAIVVMFLTVFLWFENRQLRKAGNSPEIVAYLVPHPDGNGGINLILANVGSGPAFDIRFEIVGDEADLVAHEVMVTNDSERAPIGVLPQGERIAALFGISFVLYGKVNSKNILPLLPFEILAKYRDALGRKRASKSRVDIKQFAGLAGVLSKPPIASAAESLKDIEIHLGKIAKQSSRFSAFVDISSFGEKYLRKAKGVKGSE